MTKGPRHPLSQPGAQTCPELSLRPAELGSHHKGTREGTTGWDKEHRIDPQQYNFCTALGLGILTAQLRDTLVSFQPIYFSKFMDLRHLQTIKTPVLSRDKQMCCRVLQCDRRVELGSVI